MTAVMYKGQIEILLDDATKFKKKGFKRIAARIRKIFEEDLNKSNGECLEFFETSYPWIKFQLFRHESKQSVEVIEILSKVLDNVECNNNRIRLECHRYRPGEEAAYIYDYPFDGFDIGDIRDL